MCCLCGPRDKKSCPPLLLFFPYLPPVLIFDASERILTYMGVSKMEFWSGLFQLSLKYPLQRKSAKNSRTLDHFRRNGRTSPTTSSAPTSPPTTGTGSNARKLADLRITRIGLTVEFLHSSQPVFWALLQNARSFYISTVIIEVLKQSLYFFCSNMIF